MKIKLALIARIAILTLLATLVPQPSTWAQGTAFTYQGRLNDGADFAGGSYDLTFTMFGVASGGSAVAGPATNSATGVSNGLFTVTLNFGAGVFSGADRWLEIGARTNGGGAFTTLNPRQKITPTPYAITASNVTGVVGSGSLSGTYSSAVTLNNAGNGFTGNGAGLTSLNANNLASGTVPAAALGNAWKITGNAGTTPGTHFIGTTDNQALDFRVNNTRAFRLQPNTNGAPTVIGGSSSNSVTANVAGATIGGGDQNFIQSFPFAESYFATISGGSSNFIDYFSFNSTIGGGFQNAIGPNDYFSTIGGGLQNRMDYGAAYSTISGGQGNAMEIFARYCAIGGGAANTIQYGAQYSIIAAGGNNTILSNAEYSAISGGQNNVIHTNVSSSTIGGGNGNSMFASDSSISGGYGNVIANNSDFSAIVGGSDNMIQSGTTDAIIGGGDSNIIETNADRSTIGGGLFNAIQAGAQYTFIGGGDNNHVNTNATFAVVGGGSNNTIDTNAQCVVLVGGQLNTVSSSGHFSTIGGGKANTIGVLAQYATIPGGAANIAAGNFSFATGVGAQALHDGSFVWNDSSGLSTAFLSTGTDQFSVHAAGGARFVTGSAGVKLGSSGQYFAPGGQENLRIIRGVVDSSGNILHGAGFTVARTGTGAYTVTFSGSFADFPAVTVSAQSGVARMATTTNVGTSSAQIRTFDGTTGTGAAVDAQFHFIAVGLQ